MNTPFRGFGVRDTGAYQSQALFDEGLRQHMLRVFNYMGLASSSRASWPSWSATRRPSTCRSSSRRSNGW